MKPAVWIIGKRFWTPERFALVLTCFFALLGFFGWFILGLVTTFFAWRMWILAWHNPNYGYRDDGKIKTKFTEIF